MKSSGARLLASLVLVILAWLTLAAASSKKADLQPNKLMILSTTDVRGKTSPCG